MHTHNAQHTPQVIKGQSSTTTYINPREIGIQKTINCTCTGDIITIETSRHLIPKKVQVATMSHVKTQAQDEHIKHTVSFSENDSNVMSTSIQQ